MLSTLQRLFAIFLLRAGPRDLPAEARLPIVLVAAYVLAGAIVLAPGDSLGEGMLQAGFDAGLLAGFVWLVLRLRGFAERFNQTYAAMMGVNLCFTLLIWPLISMQPEIATEAALAADSAAGMAQIALMLLLLWSLIAQGQVLRSAIESGAGVGLLLAFVYFLLSSLLFAAVFVSDLASEAVSAAVFGLAAAAASVMTS